MLGMKLLLFAETIFQNPETLVNGISKNDLLDLLNLATKESLHLTSFTFR